MEQENKLFKRYTLSDKEFTALRRLIFEKSGISLHDGKKELVRTRLGGIMRKMGIATYSEYYEYVKNDKTGAELVNLLDAISTNLTSFFREMVHFNFLVSNVIPQMVERKRARSENDIRVWSAGCSTGEEPYSIACTLMDHLETIQTWDVKILATDISTNVLDTASKGTYKADRMENMPSATLRKYFQKGVKENEGYYKVSGDVGKLLAFKRFNLNRDAFPFKKKFEFIFCRNVMIYFDKPTQEVLVNKYYDSLEP